MAVVMTDINRKNVSNPYEWAKYCLVYADTGFHSNDLLGAKFNFNNNSNNNSFPANGVYFGTNINYVAVGMSLAMSGSVLVTIGGVAGYNYTSALTGFWSTLSYGPKWRQDVSQIVTAQPWARTGYSYYQTHKNN